MSVQSTLNEITRIVTRREAEDLAIASSGRYPKTITFSISVMRSPAQWHDLISANRRMIAALRKIRRGRGTESEIAGKALKRSGL